MYFHIALFNSKFYFQVNGQFSSWKKGPCMSEDGRRCGFGMGRLKMSRTCTNPRPAYGGDDCTGDKGKTEDCSMEPCPRKNLRIINVV